MSGSTRVQIENWKNCYAGQRPAGGEFEQHIALTKRVFTVLNDRYGDPKYESRD